MYLPRISEFVGTRERCQVRARWNSGTTTSDSNLRAFRVKLGSVCLMKSEELVLNEQLSKYFELMIG